MKSYFAGLTWKSHPVEVRFKFPWGEQIIPNQLYGAKPTDFIYREKGMSEEKKAEWVDHPEHYGGKDNPYEVIKVLENIMTEQEFIGFCKGTAFKYLARAKSKYGGMAESQDYKKSEWYTNYMNDFIERKRVK